MFRLDFCTSQATSNIKSDIPFHTRPPVLVTKILVHFIGTEINGIPRLVGFIHDNLLQIDPLKDPNSVQIVEDLICFAYELSSIVIDSLLLQSAFVKTRMLGFADEGFEIMLGLNVSDTEHITLSTECVGNHIRLAWVITNLTVVIVEEFYPSALTHIKFPLIEDML
ncbi:hypothetical protein HanPI659440_Chr05g0214861 [Helianthus annuus]|nr:hypothetical protein HanPI659440_Chr05g0214861 [Helianthus annuus]